MYCAAVRPIRVPSMRTVVSDVQMPEMEYQLTRSAVERIDRVLRPAAKLVLQKSRDRFEIGQEDPLVFLATRQEYNTVVKQYLDTLVRHRRAMLDLNTAVGRRILP